MQKPITDKVLQRDQQRAQNEIEQIQRNCTFKPSLVNNRPNSAYNRSSSVSNFRPPIEDRLIAEVEKRRENREKIKRDQDIEEMKECSF